MAAAPELRTQAWAIERTGYFDLKQFKPGSGGWSPDGILELVEGRLRYTNHKGEVVYDAPLQELQFEFPALYVGHGFNVVVDDDHRYYMMFAVGRGDVSQFFALIKGRKVTKAWRAILQG